LDYSIVPSFCLNFSFSLVVHPQAKGSGHHPFIRLVLAFDSFWFPLPWALVLHAEDAPPRVGNRPPPLTKNLSFFSQAFQRIHSSIPLSRPSFLSLLFLDQSWSLLFPCGYIFSMFFQYGVPNTQSLSSENLPFFLSGVLSLPRMPIFPWPRVAIHFTLGSVCALFLDFVLEVGFAFRSMPLPPPHHLD